MASSAENQDLDRKILDLADKKLSKKELEERIEYFEKIREALLK